MDNLAKVEPQERHGWQCFQCDWRGERRFFQGQMMRKVIRCDDVFHILVSDSAQKTCMI